MRLKDKVVLHLEAFGTKAVHEIKIMGSSENSVATKLAEAGRDGFVIGEYRKGERFKDWRLTEKGKMYARNMRGVRPPQREKHKYADKTCIVKFIESKGGISQLEVKIYDWYENVFGESYANYGNPWSKDYCLRIALENLPKDNNVLFGIVNNSVKYTFHESEIIRLKGPEDNRV